MKKILVLGDIHANFPALQAIWRYVWNYRFDRIVNTGDFTVYSTFPNETIHWLRRRKNSISILGNTDRRVLRILDGKNLKRPKKEEKRIMYYWTAETLFPGNVKYLKTLPAQTDFTFGNIHFGVFHGTFHDKNETLFPNTPESRFRELASGSPFRVHIMGHSHTPYYKIIDGIHFINPGSVGRMFDGDPRTAFAILELSKEKISVKHYRIHYPVKEVINGLKQHSLPDIYAKMYRVGKKLN